MTRGNRDLATGLGASVRVLLVLVKAAWFVAGLGLVVYGIWLFDPRIAYIGGGAVLAFLFWPRPDRRT